MTAGMLQFDPEMRQALSLAHQEAVRAGHRRITPGHILLGLLQSQSRAAQILQAHSPNLETLRQDVDQHVPLHEKTNHPPSSVELHESTQKLLELATRRAVQKKSPWLTAIDMLFALMTLDDEPTQSILSAANIDQLAILKSIDEGQED